MDVEAIRRFTILASAVDHSWRAMEKSLESEWVLPALTLTYCFIDNMAYLAADESESRVRLRFERWVTGCFHVEGYVVKRVISMAPDVL